MPIRFSHETVEGFDEILEISENTIQERRKSLKPIPIDWVPYFWCNFHNDIQHVKLKSVPKDWKSYWQMKKSEKHEFIKVKENLLAPGQKRHLVNARKSLRCSSYCVTDCYSCDRKHLDNNLMLCLGVCDYKAQKSDFANYILFCILYQKRFAMSDEDMAYLF